MIFWELVLLYQTTDNVQCYIDIMNQYLLQTSMYTRKLKTK